jgi:hypothetical protein
MVNTPGMELGLGIMLGLGITLAIGPPTTVGEVGPVNPPTECGADPLPLEVVPPDELVVEPPLCPPDAGMNGLGSPYKPDCRSTGMATALPTKAKIIKQNAINDFFILFLV